MHFRQKCDTNVEALLDDAMVEFMQIHNKSIVPLGKGGFAYSSVEFFR